MSTQASSEITVEKSESLPEFLRLLPGLVSVIGICGVIVWLSLTEGADEGRAGASQLEAETGRAMSVRARETPSHLEEPLVVIYLVETGAQAEMASALESGLEWEIPADYMAGNRYAAIHNVSKGGHARHSILEALDKLGPSGRISVVDLTGESGMNTPHGE